MSTDDEAIDRMIAAVGEAIDGRRPLLDDWRVDARDVLTDLEIAIARARHPDDRSRLVVMLGTFAGMWFDIDHGDALWLGEPVSRSDASVSEPRTA